MRLSAAMGAATYRPLPDLPMSGRVLPTVRMVPDRRQTHRGATALRQTEEPVLATKVSPYEVHMIHVHLDQEGELKRRWPSTRRKDLK
jgi:hypothetical protein